ncbi:MAG: SLC13 family permease [Dehalococcoidales bacterium]|jgi:Na+/H+ antiporter NhaD/arsenite permease-like protein
MFSLSQILAIVIFVLMFAAIASGKIPRHTAVLAGAGLMIAVVFLGTMHSPGSLWDYFNLTALGHTNFWLPGSNAVEAQGFNWQTIIFIGCMMIIVGWLETAGLFRWLCLYTARLTGYRVIPILISFIILSGFLSMFIGSITVMLFLSMVTIELARLLKFDPVPMIIAEIFAANTGGSATLSGDPPNIIVGTAFGFSFTDFIANTGVIAWAAMVLVIIFFFLVLRKTLKQETSPAEAAKVSPPPGSAITNPRAFRLALAVFALIVVLLITHAYTGLSVAAIGVICAIVSLALSGKKAGAILRGIDWHTLLFFSGLFFCVGGLEVSGVLEKVSEGIGNISHGNTGVAMAMILWLSAFLSAFVDNIPFAAAMVPVIRDLSLTGINLPAMAWTLSLGADIGGNATPIGASANVVGIAICEKEGYPISWGKFTKYAALLTVLVIGFCHLLLYFRYA